MDKWEFCGKKETLRARTFLLLLGLPLFLFSVFSCNDEEGYLRGQGTLLLQLKADTAFVATEKTKAVSSFDKFKDVSNYKVEISQGEQIVASYEKYSDMPASIELKSGTYQLKASLGDLLPAEFESPYFAGSTKFQVETNQTTTVNATCTLANTKVSVAYSDDFKEAYPDYSLALTTSYTSSALLFKKEESRSAYFKADSTGQKLNMSLSMTSIENKEKTFTPPAITIKPREDVKLLFKTDGEAVSGVKLEITIDNSTVDTTVNVGVPDYMLPLEAPLITPVGFVSGEELEIAKEDGNNNDLDLGVNLFAGGTIDSCIVEINSSYLKSKGLKERYDLAHLSEDDKNSALADYFPVDGAMYKQRSYNLDLKSKLVKKLGMDESTRELTHEFKFIVKDSLKAHQTSQPVIFKVRPVVPEIRLVMTEGDVWAKHAILKAEVIKGNPAVVRFFKGTSHVTVPYSIEGRFVSCKLEGLEPATSYSVKAVYGRYSFSKPSTEVYTFLTETELQLQNSGFEEWTEEVMYEEESSILGKVTPEMKTWYPYLGSDIYWNSSNQKTIFKDLPDGIKESDLSSKKNNYILKAGVESTSEISSGSFAAKITTVGWGKTTKKDKEVLSVEHITPGKLFLGTDDINCKGVEFNSRPTALSFFYKYIPLGSESFKVRAVLKNGEVEIGSAEMVSSLATTRYNYMRLPLVYNEANTDKKATHLYIEFLSSDKGDKSSVTKSIEEYKGIFSTYYFYQFKGSSLFIDDVKLEY